ncbi:LOW QUALITY PROTEIN: acetylserotonin O-methyltransferase-like [Bufo gargarizans]|uniref:LOW QUALITY PROTEIN: acetylserotonin O-methyltransferase-like n=1 Tax=Bufo gargarizans TaxID=30331 RepID=UPI001CF5AC3C|nr:LOW QUALITY PROTEIN: acetylserotonin O-methyltransferase-like [Bufo gargarizans]
MPPPHNYECIEIFLQMVLSDLEKLENIRPRKYNLSRVEMSALQSLERDKSIIIKPSDKGGNLVILDQPLYVQMCMDLLKDRGGYGTLTSNPTIQFKAELKSILDEGCTGSLAKQLVSTYKESTVTIMDMPNVLQAAKKHFATDSNNINFLEDFFNDAIPEADLFILARILHDWTEDKCLKLLKKIYQSCKPGGGVLLVEVVLNEDRSGPLIGQLFSLNMLLQTEGKEQTSSEYTKLLTESGFRDIKVKVTGKLYDAILGRK